MLGDRLLVSKHYNVLKQMKPGAGATVFLVENDSQEKFVAKYSYVKENEKSRFEEQMRFWRKLCSSCNYVVLLKEYYFYDETNACVIMEFCEEGDLQTLIEKRKEEKSLFREEEIMKILSDVLQGLYAMHVMKIIHRDVKPANILICKGGLYKMADFNVSRSVDEAAGNEMTMTGSMLYSAPEKFENQNYSFPADLFSVGVVLYELMTLTKPFASLAKILGGECAPINVDYSEPLASLVWALMARKPENRPTAAAVLSLPFVVSASVRSVREDAYRRIQQAEVEARAARSEVRKMEARMAELFAFKERAEETISRLEEKIAMLELGSEKGKGKGNKVRIPTPPEPVVFWTEDGVNPSSLMSSSASPSHVSTAPSSSSSTLSSLPAPSSSSSVDAPNTDVGDGASSSFSSSAVESFPFIVPDCVVTKESVTTTSRSTLSFGLGGYITMLIDKKISTGIWKGVFEVVSCVDDYYRGPYFGLASKTAVFKVTSTWLGEIKGTCMFSNTDIYISGKRVSFAGNPLFLPLAKIQEVQKDNNSSNKSGGCSQRIVLEYNASTNPRTLHIFSNGEQKARCITHLPEDVFMGVSSGRALKIKVMSFQQVTAPTVNAALPTVGYAWE